MGRHHPVDLGAAYALVAMVGIRRRCRERDRSPRAHRADIGDFEEFNHGVSDGINASGNPVSKPADLNGDHRPDIVCVDSATANLKWYENLAAGANRGYKK